VIGIIGGSRKDGKSSFTTLIKYCADRPGVPHTGTLNIMFSDAASEMLATARMNPRSKDPLMHIILSWREMELPSNEQIDEAVRIALEELDLQNNTTSAESTASGSGYDAGTGALALALLTGFSLGIPRKRTR
jgi:hypothetical protein